MREFIFCFGLFILSFLGAAAFIFTILIDKDVRYTFMSTWKKAIYCRVVSLTLFIIIYTLILQL